MCVYVCVSVSVCVHVWVCARHGIKHIGAYTYVHLIKYMFLSTCTYTWILYKVTYSTCTYT